LAQPLETSDVIGGESVVKMTQGVEPGSIEAPAQEAEDKAALKEKSMVERLQDKLGQGKEMISSKFGSKDKESKEDSA